MHGSMCMPVMMQASVKTIVTIAAVNCKSGICCNIL